MPPTRREIIKILGAASAQSVLTGCIDSRGGRAPANPVNDEEFDFPVAMALPFAHGVASGDPMADRVIIWTRITQNPVTAAQVAVDWYVATDPEMQTIIRSGQQLTDVSRDWTVKVDVTGLSAAQTYYYRFAALGAQSLIGRTRTAPREAVSSLRLAVVACSSYWSSYWSGYGHIAERNDLDLVVHCGDYIYDFVDEDEAVRSRYGEVDTRRVDDRDWTNLDECRRRYALFRSDPNLVRAHQQHPWTIVWDNHDISTSYGNELPSPELGEQVTTTLDDVCRAFYEWTPTRPPRGDGSGEFMLINDGSYPQPQDPRLIWRKLDFGPLADLFCVDTQIHLRNDMPADASHLPSGASLFSRDQFEWLTQGMLASQNNGKTWRLVLNQTWVAPITVPPIVDGFGPADPLGISRWSDFPEERAAWFSFLRGDNQAGERVHNNIVLSGDAHGNWAADLVEDNALLSSYQSALPTPNLRSGSTPTNQLAGFQRLGTNNTALLNTRADSVGVEFAPSSMGRGGADEIVANANPLSTVVDQVLGARALELVAISGNKATQFIEWVDHGYGIVHLTAERAVFEYWWQDKLTPGSPDVLGQQMISFANNDTSNALLPKYQDQIDPVGHHGETLAATQGERTAAAAPEGAFDPK